MGSHMLPRLIRFKRRQIQQERVDAASPLKAAMKARSLESLFARPLYNKDRSHK